jgi:hypothetical protein
MKRAPELKVITANIQPVHMAILEGDEEIFFTEQRRLEERFNGIPSISALKAFSKPIPKLPKSSTALRASGRGRVNQKFYGISFAE